MCMLYIVGTPIGNLEDLSLRAAKVIAGADVVLAEDTRSFLKLKSAVKRLFSLQINHLQKVISYYKEIEMERISLVLDMLGQGKDVVLISEAGMPVVNDPGQLLVRAVREQNIPYTVIPGPVAFAAAVVFAGFSFSSVVFLGFFPKRKRSGFLQKLEDLSRSLPEAVFVFYESPKRIKKTLRQILDYFEKRVRIVVCHEMSKIYEQIIEIRDHRNLQGLVEKGEYTVVFKFQS